MAVLFFSLRGVPADEAEDVRELLIAHEIAFYETPPGNWGVSMPAIWLYTREDLEKIQPFFDDYQKQRCIEQRQRYLQYKQSQQGRYFSNINLFKLLKLASYTIVMLYTLYVSIKWLFEMGL